MRRSVSASMLTLLLMASAGIVTAQEPGQSPGPGSQRVEIPEAGISLAFPDDWSAVVQMVREQAELPPELSGSAPVDRWIVVDAAAPDGSGCGLVMYGEHPLSFEQHAEWIASSFADEADVTSAQSSHVVLPLGDAIRFDVAVEGTGYWTSYLFESDEARYQLGCMAAQRPADDWLSVIETVEFIPFEPIDSAGGDGEAQNAGVGYVLGFPSVVSVVDPATPDFPMGALMNADCAYAIRIPADDGSATEWLACTLSDEPLIPPEQQGVPPSEVLTQTGGKCIWRSDYWYETDQTEVLASSYSLVITPDGQVYGRSTYPAEPLDCPGM